MKYRVKQVTEYGYKPVFYAQFSQFGIFWKNCFLTQCGNDYFIQTYSTFNNALQRCNDHRGGQKRKILEPRKRIVEITEVK